MSSNSSKEVKVVCNFILSKTMLGFNMVDDGLLDCGLSDELVSSLTLGVPSYLLKSKELSADCGSLVVVPSISGLDIFYLCS